MGYQRDLETTVRMQLYTLKKSHIFLYLILFSTIMIPAVLISALGPPVLWRSTHYATDNLPHGRTLLNGFYKINSDPVLLLQKEIWFSAVIHRENSDRLISIPLTVNISVLCRTYPEKVKDGDESKLDAGDIIAIERYQKNVTLVCMERKPCNEIQLIHIGQLKCPVYTFKVRFLGLLALKDDSDVPNARKSRAVHPRIIRSGRKSQQMIAPSVGADKISNKYYYAAADDEDVDVGNSIEDTDLDLVGSQTVDDEYDTKFMQDDSNLNKVEKKLINEDDNYLKISVEDENSNNKFGPVMEEENKETNNTVIPNFAIQEIEFITQTRNPTFSYYEMFSRAVSFIAAFYLFFVFITSLNTFPWEHWTVEQKWTSTILFLLLLYYDPLHPLMYLLPGWIPGALDSFFAISFYTYLLFYWISIFDALRAADTSCLCFYFPRLLLTTTIWLLFTASNGWILHSEYTNPLFDFIQQTVVLRVFFALFGILMFLYLLYFFVQLFRSYSELKAMPYYVLRLTFLLIPILFSAVNFLIILAVRFSPTGSVFFLRPPTYKLINSNSTSGHQRPFTPSYAAFPAFRSAIELGLNFGIAFSLCLLMTRAYLPIKTSLAEANYKDNPSVSLACDSDEDVMYDFDRDDIPLRRTVRSS